MIFILAAAAGALSLGVRMLFLLAGIGEGGDGLDSDDGFNALSLQGLSSFLLLFGLTGLALFRQGMAGSGLSVAGGLAAGAAALWMVGRLFRAALRLQSSGTVSNQEAAGCQGTIYQNIPAGGIGRVTVRMGRRLREMDAAHEDGSPLPTGTPVRVVRVDGSLAVVRPHSPLETPCLKT